MYAQRLRHQLLQPRLHRNHSRTNFFVRNEHPALLQILHGKISFEKKQTRRFKSGVFFLSVDNSLGFNGVYAVFSVVTAAISSERGRNSNARTLPAKQIKHKINTAKFFIQLNCAHILKLCFKAKNR